MLIILKRFFAQTYTCLDNRLSFVSINEENRWNIHSVEKHLILDETMNDPRMSTSKRDAGFGFGIAPEKLMSFIYVREARTTAECICIYLHFVSPLYPRQMSDTRTYAL